MICEKCGKNIATTHIETYVNGKQSSMNLCSACAAEEGAANPFQMGLGGLLGSIFGDALGAAPAGMPTGAKCGFCGSTFEEIARTGRVGCANCYTTFYDRLMPTLSKLHGNTAHVGKIPGSAKIDVGAAETEPAKSEEETLRAALGKAIKDENFEEAARLRDQINALKGKVQDDE